MTSYGTIEIGRAGPVVTVSLNRPAVRNAFNAQMIEELTDIFRRLADGPEARVVILRGNGATFSAGADVSWMRAGLEYSSEENMADAARMSDMFGAIEMLPLPVVARVHGAALGGGMGLMAVADIVVASEGTIFGFTEARLGIIPAVISRFVLPKIGEGWARALYLTAERFGPDVAQRIGLVHWIAPADDLDAVVAAKVDELLSSGPSAIRAAKDLILRMRDLDDADRRSLTIERIAAIRASDEGQEGLRAFLDKRAAAWRASEPE
jgi:methylglutaconyl-CoA hydratase